MARNRLVRRNLGMPRQQAQDIARCVPDPLLLLGVGFRNETKCVVVNKSAVRAHGPYLTRPFSVMTISHILTPDNDQSLHMQVWSLSLILMWCWIRKLSLYCPQTCSLAYSTLSHCRYLRYQIYHRYNLRTSGGRNYNRLYPQRLLETIYY
jgi:hypothetical protein